MIRKIQAFFNPEQFKGWYKKKRYFEDTGRKACLEVAGNIQEIFI